MPGSRGHLGGKSMPVLLEQLYTDSSGPSISKEVLKELKRFDKNIHVTFSSYSIDPTTGRPIEVFPENIVEVEGESPNHALEKRGNSWFVRDPRFYVWAATDDGDVVMAKSIPADEGFDRRQIDILRQDKAAMERLTEFLEAKFAHQKMGEKKAQENWRQYQKDIVLGNKLRIKHLVEDGRIDAQRDAKIFSYPGQVDRSTPGQVVKSGREAGWEKPE